MMRTMMSSPAPTLSDEEALELLAEARQQYRRYGELAKLVEGPDEAVPVYSWDNPIGLVINAVMDRAE